MKKILLASVFAVVGSVNVHAADFGGAYIGGDIGYSKKNIGDGSAKGFTGGALAGYGTEVDKWYIGGEIGGGLTNVKGDLADGKIEKKNYYTGAARLGYKAKDKVMAYGLVGVEGAQFAVDSSKYRDWGYRYGLGVETFVQDNITVRGQLDYVDWQGKNDLPKKGEWRSTVGVAYHF